MKKNRAATPLNKQKFMGCINTIRIESFIDKSSHIYILSAFMRFGVGDSYVDNAHAGGFYVGIDFKNGRLKNIGHQYMEYGGASLKKHPESGYTLEGFEIPFFQEAVDLVRQTLTKLPDRYLGWDIAITPTGPLIIEANEYPSIFMADIAYGGYLKHPLIQTLLRKRNYSAAENGLIRETRIRQLLVCL